MKRKITREIFVEIETVRVTKKRSAQEKKTNARTKPNISVEICNYAGSFSRTGEHSEDIFNKHF